jgi:hypothetical protein
MPPHQYTFELGWQRKCTVVPQGWHWWLIIHLLCRMEPLWEKYESLFEVANALQVSPVAKVSINHADFRMLQGLHLAP